MGNERIPENFAENSSNWPISAVFLQNLQIIKLQIFRFSACTPLSSDYLFYNSLKIIVLGGGGGIDWFIESRSLNGMGSLAAGEMFHAFIRILSVVFSTLCEPRFQIGLN